MTTAAQTTAVNELDPIGRKEWRALAEEAYRRNAEIIGTISDDEWLLPTDCTGWTVRDLAGHLLGAMRSAASLREMLSQRRQIGARVKAHGGDETDVMTQVQIERTASLDTTALAAEASSLVAAAARGRFRTPAPMRLLVRFPVTFGNTTEQWNLGYLVDTILTRDTWLHRVDLCRALGRELQLDAAHDGRIIADVVAEWARRHNKPFTLHLTGPAGGRFISDSGSGELIKMDAVEFCRILSGRGSMAGLLGTDVPF